MEKKNKLKRHGWLLTICLLSVVLFSPKAKSDCVGCGLELLIFPAIYAGVDIATASAPKLFLKKDQSYSYRKTYNWGLGLAVASMLAVAVIYQGDSVDRGEYEFIAGTAGLITGNYIGYKRSFRDEVKPGVSLSFRQQQPVISYSLAF